jgi:tellurite resistance protein TehA-like permease
MVAMPPGVFAFVMATGIVSIAAAQEGHGAFSWALFAVGAAAYVVLAALVVRHGTELRRVEVLTFVAGTGVLAARLALAGDARPALGLSVLAFAVWAALVPGVARELARRAASRRTGSALLAVVAPESLAIAAAILGRRFDVEQLTLAGEALWAAGLAAYVLLAPAIGRRLLREHFLPDDWIAMGALAIATLAAAELGKAHAAFALWIAATLWLPFLLAFELHRGVRRYELRRWATVFPLGMYAVATYEAGRVDRVGALSEVAEVAFWVAVAAWALAALGLARRFAR